MKKSFKLVTLAGAALALVACSNQSSEKTSSKSSQSADLTLRETAFGSVQGVDAGKVLTWYGVPYAGDVSGENRWIAPQDPEKWSETLDTTEPGEVAIQLSNGEVVGEENALNLDIYRPDSEAKDLPVMVFIHGGNNQTGKSTEISGASFVEDHDAIVVSVNYRLGALGFNPLQALKTGTDEENSGNYTLLDIAKSLQWVRDNIENFGGDSANVTLAGFSAGGRDVMATLISPTFEGLYDKAISFSGGLTLSDTAASQDVFASAIAPLVVEDGVKSNEEEAKAWLLSDDASVKDYLLKVDAGRLAGLMGNASIRMSVFPHLYTDGKVIPEEGFATKDYNDVPLLNLTGSSEFSLFSLFSPTFMSAVQDGSIATNETLASQYQFVANYGGQLYDYANVKGANEKLTQQGYTSDIYSTEVIFGHDKAVVGDQMALLGAFHGVFVPLLDTNSQNYASLVGEAYASDGAQALSKTFQDYLYNFIKTGNPNGDGLTTWNPWNDKQEVLQLDATSAEALATLTTQDDLSPATVIEAIAADTSISDVDKETMIKTVLNGRWFSYELDKAYDNLSEFDQANHQE
ncbi:carboxylesterase family protein [Streptococcus caprae]|uniref:Carboxylic ester hydrolase n=1 Tax=Streptococcus caprae TaxID=1640501 RepID=A0ABV8CV29_9STRE